MENESSSKTDKNIYESQHIRRKKSFLTKDKMKLFLKQHVEINSDGIWIIKQTSINDFGINKVKFEQIFDGPLPNFEVSSKKVKQETLIKYLTKSNASNPSLQNNNEKKNNQKEENKNKKSEEKEITIDINKEIKEWYKPKEDLDLEDQKKMPKITPVEMKIPIEHFGDMLMLIEFVNSFDEVLLVKDFFPTGLSLDIIENALFESEVCFKFSC